MTEPDRPDRPDDDGRGVVDPVWHIPPEQGAVLAIVVGCVAAFAVIMRLLDAVGV